jgi:hypothetical protein
VFDKTISFHVVGNQDYFVAFVIGAVMALLSVTLIAHLEMSSGRTSVGWKTTKCNANTAVTLFLGRIGKDAVWCDG